MEGLEMQDRYWTRLTEQRIGRRRALSLAGGTATAVSLLAACGGGQEGGSVGDKATLVAESVDTFKAAKRGGILKDHDPKDTPTFDFATPISAGGGASSCYACLVRAIPGYLKPTESELEPDMAESWEWSPDGLQVVLKLRQGVRFHNKPPVNGRVLDMEDVLFSWKRFADKASNRVNVVNAVNPGAPVLSFTATDPRTIVIKLNEPLVYALDFFAPFSGGGNMAVLPKETDTTFDVRTDAIGTGPFYLSNYQPSVGFTFRRHPEYYDTDYFLLDRRDVPIVPEYATALAQFKAGNIHYFNLIRAEDVLSVKQEEPRILVYATDVDFSTGSNSYGPTFGWLPEGKSPFLDERVRQAVSMSWDRDLWLDTFFNVSKFESQGLPVETRWNSHVGANWDGWWLDPESKEFGPNAKYFQHNVAEAKKMLAAAGYQNGFTTTSNLAEPSGPQGPTAKFALVSDNMAADVGITVKTNYVDYNTQYIPIYRDGNGQYEGWSYPSLSGSSISSLHPIRSMAAQYWPKGGVAFKGFSTSGRNDQSGDPALTAMIEKARLEPDTERRRALVFDLQRYLAKAMWGLASAGDAAKFVMAWPALGNFRVWRGGHRPHYRIWLDESKPPFTNT
jgi:peptide/nickel transport system substrate-binding protein